MNAFIHFNKDKQKFKCLIFPETFYKDIEQFRTIQNSVSKRFHIGYLDTDDIGINVLNPEIGIENLKVEQINETHSEFPGPFNKNVEFSHKKGNLWLKRVPETPEEEQILWEKVYWASLFLEEYGSGDYDFILVGSNWLKDSDILPQRNTISFEDFTNLVRSNNAAHRNFLLNSRDNNIVGYDFYYLVNAILNFTNYLILIELFNNPQFIEKFDSERQRDIRESLASFEHRLKNVIMSYDEANYELFLSSYSSRIDYRVSSFFSECISAIEDLARIFLVLFSDETSEKIFTQPIRLYHYNIKKLITEENKILFDMYTNLEIKERVNILRTIRNKMQHGDAINIEDWRLENEIIKVPELKLLHIDFPEDLLKNYLKDYNLYLKPFWRDEKDKEEGKEPIGYTLPLRETLDFAFDSILIVINSLVIALIENFLDKDPSINIKQNKLTLFKEFCKKISPNRFKNYRPNIFLNYSNLYVNQES